MSTLLQKIVVKKGLEPIESWSSLVRNPNSFLEEVASRLMLSWDIDPESVVISDKVPDSSDRTKIWIKTSWPYGIGKIIDGNYQMDYGMSGYMPNIPFQAASSVMEPLKGNVRKLSDNEVKAFGLYSAPEEKATSKMSWYIFEPKEITY